jgi:hypothetical protein
MRKLHKIFASVFITFLSVHALEVGERAVQPSEDPVDFVVNGIRVQLSCDQLKLLESPILNVALTAWHEKTVHEIVLPKEFDVETVLCIADILADVHAGQSFDAAILRVITSKNRLRVLAILDYLQAKKLEDLIARNITDHTVSIVHDTALLAAHVAEKHVKLIDDAFASICCEQQIKGPSKIFAIAISPDEQLVAAACNDGFARIWDISTGTCVREFHEGDQKLVTVAFSYDGSLLAVAGDAHLVNVYNVKTGRLVANFVSNNYVLALVFSPVSNELAVASWARRIKLFELLPSASIILRKILPGHTGWVRALAFSPMGKLLASGSLDYDVRLWDVVRGTCLRVFKGHTAWVRTVAFSPDGKLLASAGSDKVARIWDVATGETIQLLKGHTEPIVSTAFSSNGALVATASNDKTARVWRVASGACARIIKKHTAKVRSALFMPQRQTLITAGFDRKLCLWGMSKLKTCSPIQKIFILAQLPTKIPWTTRCKKMLCCTSQAQVSDEPTYFEQWLDVYQSLPEHALKLLDQKIQKTFDSYFSE